ncbi:MAG: hypothetical protein AAF235_09995 [Planctomycetota bacterium]
MNGAIPDFGWMLIALVAAATLLSLLHVFASSVRNHVYLHDTRVQVATLQARYARELRRLTGMDDIIECDVVGGDGNADVEILDDEASSADASSGDAASGDAASGDAPAGSIVPESAETPENKAA